MASEPSSPKQSPSFKDRLQLDAFRYKDAATTARRSPRLMGAGGAQPVSSAVLSRSTTSSSSARASSVNRKRKGGDGDPGDSTADDGPASGRASPAVSTSSSTKRKKSSGYAPPSTYAHLPLLPDALGPNLLVLFVGLNPGVETARTGHAYAHPSNLFWKLLHSSGVTTRLCSPTEDGKMPKLFSLGLTNIVSRPSRNGAELAKSELDDGVAVLERKARRWRPGAVCIVGKSIWESIWRVRHGRAIKKEEFRYGWQDEAENMGRLPAEEDEDGDEDLGAVEEGVVASDDWNGAKVFVGSSTSGLAASLSKEEKERIWRELGVWVEQRRAERAAAAANAP